ncbi:MAG: M3 family oligoendopeptidase [Nitrosopumilaceae archaeon]
MECFDLGEWDLTKLVKNYKSPQFAKKIQEIKTRATNFEKNKAHLKESISSKRFFKILNELEEISKEVSIVSGYSSLLYSANTQSDEATTLLTTMTKLSSEVENKTLFFDQWWKKKINQKNADRLLRQAGQLTEFLGHKRKVAKYSLSEPEEKIVNTLDVTGSAALVKLYDKITNSFQYVVKIDGTEKKYNREQLTQLIKNQKSRIREVAYKSLLAKYDEHKGVLGEIYQNLVLNWKNECLEIRNYSSPISVRNIGNDLENKTVDSLLTICKNNAHIFQTYFKHKAKMLGMKKLRRYDIYAPALSKSKQKTYKFDQAAKLVLKTLNEFSPQLSEYARKIFTQKHIDSSVRHGKRNGAFCSTISPDISPYVFVNFVGKTNDVFTLAHELGHAVHSQSASDKSIFVQEASLPLAETASTFSEVLLYDEILNKVSDDEKLLMLTEQVDDLYSTIMRQAFFTAFEISAHDKIGNGATIEEINLEYKKNLKEQFANSIEVSENFGIEWSCIPHFYHAPFYCYAYSFGNLLALSFFQRYKEEGRSFVPIYLEILRAGGSKKPETLLKEYDIDITSEKFWQSGFTYIKSQIDMLVKS